MRKLITIYFLVAAFPTILFAANPKATGMVTDKAKILSDSQLNQVETLLRQYKERSTNEIAILIVPSLEGRDIKEYANSVFHEWGIGIKGKDNGLLFLWSTGDRKMRFEIGYGLEAVLPDGRAGQIIREIITPEFRDKNWFVGLFKGLNAAIGQIDSATSPAEKAVISSTQQPSDNSTLIYACLIGGVLLVVLGVIIFLHIRKRDEEEQKEFNDLLEKHKEGLTNSYNNREPNFKKVYPSPSTSERSYSRASTTERKHTDYSAPSIYVAPTPRYDPPSSPTVDTSSSSGGSDFGGFSGGNSGGGGADGSY